MKILAIASAGGHWIELLRLRPAFDKHEVVYISTRSEFAETVAGHRFIQIKDSSHWEKNKALRSAMHLYKILKQEKPDWIITTGAAPGLISLSMGKLLGFKTIWIESMCHAEKISISGKMASVFCSRAYTQWEHLQTNKFHYAGNIML